MLSQLTPPSPVASREAGGFSAAEVEEWRRDGAVLLPRFFGSDEVHRVEQDFDALYGRGHGGTAQNKKKAGEIGRFDDSQFTFFGPIPVEGSPAVNLLGVHPSLIALARAALGVEDVIMYQCLVWAKFTGHTDYDQAFHCDYPTHTLTVPGDGDMMDAITFACYFNDVTEAHGPLHYVPRTESAKIAPAEATSVPDPARDAALNKVARSTASPAGSVFAFAMDTYHRGTNLTAPNGHRYTVFSSFKRTTSHAVGYHAWPFYDMKPWKHIIDHATPDQLACFGIPRPGHEFWNEVTLRRMSARHPGWNPAPYRSAIEVEPSHR